MFLKKLLVIFTFLLFSFSNLYSSELEKNFEEINKNSNLYKFEDDEFKINLSNKINLKLKMLQNKYNININELINVQNDIDELLFYSLIENKELAEKSEERSIYDNISFVRKDFESTYQNINNLSGDELKKALKKNFFEHISYGYREAREYMFSEIDNYNGYVRCIYTGKELKTNSIPDHTVMNCEHTWPQSKGATGIAKTDLHHLFPSDSKANSRRSSWDFGNVSGKVLWQEGGSKLGSHKKSRYVFEVRDDHKGNTARAMFYFSTIYNKKIHSEYEKTLREWHEQDPVDQKEIERNNRIEKIQNNRNPFVDHPEFVGKITDF